MVGGSELHGAAQEGVTNLHDRRPVPLGSADKSGLPSCVLTLSQEKDPGRLCAERTFVNHQHVGIVVLSVLYARLDFWGAGASLPPQMSKCFKRSSTMQRASLPRWKCGVVHCSL